MELRIKFIDDEGKEIGICHIYKLVGNELKSIGEIKYADESDKRWILRNMTQDHPNVSVIP